MPDGAHTHGHGGGGLDGRLVLLLVVLFVGAPAAGAVAGAVTELVHLLVMVVIGVVVTAVLAGAAVLVYRRRHPRPALPPRAVPAAAVPWAPRAAGVVSPPGARAALPASATAAGGIHLHLHGVDPAEVAAILDAARLAPSPRPEGVARDGQE